MTVAQRLEKHGWIRVAVRKAGCFKHVLWLDPKTNQVRPQADAVRHQVYRNAVARDAKARKFVLVDAREAANTIRRANDAANASTT